MPIRAPSDHAADRDRPGQRQHRSRGDALTDGAAAGQNAAGAHQAGADQMAAHLMIVVEGFPAQFIGEPAPQRMRRR